MQNGMRKLTFVLVALLASTANLCAQNAKYPPLSEYMMQPDAEVALAKSAAPQKISAGATIKILTASGYKTAAQGNNGFTCMVMRGWSAPTFTPPPERDLVYDSKLRAPICFESSSVTNHHSLSGATNQAGYGGQETRADR